MKKFKKIKHKFRRFWDEKIAHHLASGIGSANLGLIFLAAMGNFLGSAQFVLFPIAIGASTLTAILSIREAYQKKNKHSSAVADAVTNTITALGIMGAVICALIGGATLGVVAPAILTGTLGLNALYDLGAACYCWYKYHHYKNKNPDKAEEFYKKAKKYIIGFAISALGATAAGAVLLANKTTFGIVGITAGALGTGLAVYGGYKAYKKHQTKLKERELEQIPMELENISTELLSSGLIYHTLGYDHHHDAITYENSRDSTKDALLPHSELLEYPVRISQGEVPMMDHYPRMTR